MEEHSSTLCNYRPSFLIIFENDFSKHGKLILNLIDFQPDPENSNSALSSCVPVESLKALFLETSLFFYRFLKRSAKIDDLCVRSIEGQFCRTPRS